MAVRCPECGCAHLYGISTCHKCGADLISAKDLCLAKKILTNPPKLMEPEDRSIFDSPAAPRVVNAPINSIEIAVDKGAGKYVIQVRDRVVQRIHERGIIFREKESQIWTDSIVTRAAESLRESLKSFVNTPYSTLAQAGIESFVEPAIDEAINEIIKVVNVRLENDRRQEIERMHGHLPDAWKTSEEKERDEVVTGSIDEVREAFRKKDGS